MRTFRLFVAFAVVFALTSFGVSHQAKALPRDEVVINYYDCYWGEIGMDWRSCSGGWQYFGTHTNAGYRETILTECSSGYNDGYTLEMWDDNTNSWVPYTQGGNCYCGARVVPATC